MRPDEWSHFRDLWIDVYATYEARETDTPRDVVVAEIRFEDYVGQEGFTMRDELISMRRDRIYERFPKAEGVRPVAVVVTEHGECVFAHVHSETGDGYSLYTPDGKRIMTIVHPVHFLRHVGRNFVADKYLGAVPGDEGYEKAQAVLSAFPANPTYRAVRVVADPGSRGELMVLVEGLNLPDSRKWGLYYTDGRFYRHTNEEGR